MINSVKEIEDKIAIRNVIVSVADKSGIIEFMSAMAEICPGLTVYSTGGTYNMLTKNKSVIALRNVSDYTGQPEMQGGLVKTLDYKIYTGLLSEPGNPAHADDLKRIDGTTFDMVIVNLYPFEKMIKTDGCTVEDARSNIDIGGPCMLRASAKNFLRVAGVCDPGDYDSLLKELQENGGSLTLNTRKKLAEKTFRRTAAYDAEIAAYMESKTAENLQNDYTVAGL